MVLEGEVPAWFRLPGEEKHEQSYSTMDSVSSSTNLLGKVWLFVQEWRDY